MTFIPLVKIKHGAYNSDKMGEKQEKHLVTSDANLWKRKKKKKFFRAARGKKLVTNWKKIRIFSSFVETMWGRRQSNDTLNVLGKNNSDSNFQPRILCLVKICFENAGKLNMLSRNIMWNNF